MDGKERRIKRITFAQKEHERRRKKDKRERERKRERRRRRRRNSEWRKEREEEIVNGENLLSQEVKEEKKKCLINYLYSSHS